MKSQLLRGKLVLKKSKIHGYGVFADQEFYPDSVIEECHTLLLKENKGVLANYCFANPTGGEYLFPLGYGAIYNHHPTPNAHLFYDNDYRCLTVKALQPIKTGEEITIHYSDDWFSSRQMNEIVVKPFKIKSLALLITRGLIVIASVYVLTAVISKLNLSKLYFF